MEHAIEFERDIERYLKSKLPDVPENTVMEIATYVTNRTIIFVSDSVQQLNKSYRPQRKVSYRSYFDRFSGGDE